MGFISYNVYSQLIACAFWSGAKLWRIFQMRTASSPLMSPPSTKMPKSHLPPKRLESESGLKVREDTRGQVRRALEKAGIVFLASEQGEGVMLVRNPGGARGASRRGKFGRNMTTP